MTKNRIKRESFLHKYQRLSKVFNNSINIIRSKFSSPPESSPQVNRSLIIKNSMQRNTYPQFLPTQRAAPCDLSQAAGIPLLVHHVRNFNSPKYISQEVDKEQAKVIYLSRIIIMCRVSNQMLCFSKIETLKHMCLVLSQHRFNTICLS